MVAVQAQPRQAVVQSLGGLRQQVIVLKIWMNKKLPV